jgi:hypothetical protein
MERKKTKLVVINDFIPQDEVELELVKGDIVIFFEQDESGWIEGKNERTGKQGII